MTDRTLTINASEIADASDGRTFRELAEMASAAVEAGDYRRAHVLSMGAAVVATTRSDEDEAITAAGWAMDRAIVYQPDPLPPVFEIPARPAPVLLDWGIPVYRVAADGSHVSGPLYGHAPEGASWRRWGVSP